jgi:hypothetical protein
LPPLAICCLALAFCGGAGAEVVQHGDLRVAFDGKLTPRSLPRSGSAPVTVAVGGRISTTDGKIPPQLRRITIAINRFGRIATGSLPSCQIEQIQPATTEGALEVCGSSMVGEGSFSAKVLLPEQTPFPSAGKIYAFNGTYDGRPAILAHVYGTEPVPTSYTLPFEIGHAKGTFGTVLSVSLPKVTSEWGYITGLKLNLARTGAGQRPYASASCPAPKGFPGAVFPFARTTFAFKGGVELSTTLNRSCRVR